MNMEVSRTTVPDGRISDDHVTTLLDSVAGGRNIAILASLPKDGLSPGANLDAVFTDALDATGSNDKIDRGYVDRALNTAPPGIFTKVSDVPKTVSKYSRHFGLTEFGGTTCRSAAGHLTRLCFEYDLSPTYLVGSRQTRRSQTQLTPPFVRLAIYGNLLRHEQNNASPISIKELTKRAGISPRTMHNHLPAIIQSGIIKGFGTGKRSDYPTYQLTSEVSDVQDIDFPSIVSNQKKKLLAHVIGLLEDGEFVDEQITVNAIREYIGETNNMGEFIQSRQTHKQNESIAHVLELLHAHGVLHETAKGKERITEVKLSKMGKDVLPRYVEILAGLIVGDQVVIDNGNRITDEITPKDKRLAWLLTVDFDKGALTRREESPVRQAKMLESISERPHTTSEIMERFGLKRRAASNALLELEDQGKIIGHTIGRNISYRIAPQQ